MAVFHLNQSENKFSNISRTLKSILFNFSSVTLYRWPAKQTIPLSVLARNQTKGFWTWNLGVAGRGNGTREESWLEKGADKQLAWKHGQMRSTPETVAEKIGSSEEDWVKMSRHSSCFLEFSLVTHASVSPYMLSGMQSVA